MTLAVRFKMMSRMEQLKNLLEKEPNDAFCLYALAQEYASQGDHDRAIELYERAIASDADYLYAYFHKARSEEALGRTRLAADTLREGITRAQRAGDAKAEAEMAGYLSALDADS